MIEEFDPHTISNLETKKILLQVVRELRTGEKKPPFPPSFRKLTVDTGRVADWSEGKPKGEAIAKGTVRPHIDVDGTENTKVVDVADGRGGWEIIAKDKLDVSYERETKETT